MNLFYQWIEHLNDNIHIKLAFLDTTDQLISGGGTPVVGINLLFKASPELFNGSDLGAGWWIDLLGDKEQPFVSHEPLIDVRISAFVSSIFQKWPMSFCGNFFFFFFLTFLKIKNSCFMRFLRNRWANFKKLGHFWKFQTLSFPMS